MVFRVQHCFDKQIQAMFYFYANEFKKRASSLLFSQNVSA